MTSDNNERRPAGAQVQALKPQVVSPAGGDQSKVKEEAVPKPSKPAPKAAPKPAAPKTRPLAEPARMRRRHWGVLVSFVALVAVPLLLVMIYLWLVAEDRYSSTTGFSIRQEEGQASSELLSGLAQFTGGSTALDGNILYEFIRSENIVRRIDEELGLREYFSRYWTSDPVFALWPDATIEDLQAYWGRAVRVSYDEGSGLTQLEVRAFDPEMAQKIAQAIVDESQKAVNALNDAARSDALRYATIELEEAQQKLREAREALTKFRTRTQIVDLEADIQGRMGVMNNLQQQLAQELVAFDELQSTTQSDDPRQSQALRRIQVIRERIVEERRNFATTEVAGTGEDYPTLISEFEGLMVDREFAEQVYRAAMATRDAAYANAERQTRYLATYIRPTLAESSEYPQRFVLFGLSALFLVLSWGIGVLIYYSIRDRD